MARQKDGIYWQRWHDGRCVESGYRDVDSIDDWNNFHSIDERQLHVAISADQFKSIYGTKPKED